MDQLVEEWVLTIDLASGQTLAIARLDSATGQRKELSEEEYLALAGYDLSGAEDYSEVYGEDAYDPYAAAAGSYDPYGYEEGYYQGLADYEAMIAGAESDTSSIEAAYYQGMADYELALAQGYEGYGY